jgi:hypothetical protein
MSARSCPAMVLVSALVLAAVQTSSAQSTTPLSERTPSQNVRGSAVRERAPGLTVNQARQRHAALIAERVTGSRSGSGSQAASQASATAGTTGGTGSTLGGLAGLLSNPAISALIAQASSSGLLSQLTGGALGGLTSGGSLGGLTLGATTNQPVQAGTPATSANPNIPPNVTPDVIALLESAGIDINEVFPPTQSGSSTTTSQTSGQTRKSAQPAASTATSTKTEARSQQQSTDQPKFAVRWANAMLETTFTSLVLAFSSSAFVDLLADWLRPIFLPEETEQPADTSTGTTNPTDTGTDAGGSIVRGAAVWLPCG